MITIKADRKNTKSTSAANESIQKNLASQSLVLSSTPAGNGRSAGTLGCFQSNSYGVTSFVDALTACNDCNDDAKRYFQSNISQMLSIYDYLDEDGRVQKCFSLA